MEDKIPKRRPLVPPTMLQKIERRRHVVNTQFYFTNRKVNPVLMAKVQAMRHIQTPHTDKILSFMKYSDKSGKLAIKKSLRMPVCLKDNKRVAQSRSINERLYVEHIAYNVRTVRDLHPEFFTVIEGRPNRPNDDIKVYIDNIRNYAMLRQQIGYRNEITMKVHKDAQKEIQEYERVQSDYKKLIKNFEHFLKENYQKCLCKIKRGEKVVMELNEKNLEFYSYESSLTTVRNRIFKIDAIRNVLLLYRKYLLYVAPISWRKKYDGTYLTSAIFDSDVEIAAMQEIIEIENIVKRTAAELEHAPLPVLYFQKPSEMKDLFACMELQGREYLTHLARTIAPMAQLKQVAKQLRGAILQEQEHFEYYIHWLELAIERQVENEAIIRRTFFSIIKGVFFETVASPEALKLKICIEYVFERVFGKSEDVHQNICEPMKLLELMYEDINLKLESLDSVIVNRARKDLFAQDIRIMKLAHVATRELRQFEELSYMVRKAFWPPLQFRRAKPEKRVQAHNERNTSRTSTTALVLCDADKQNLLLFSEWCEGLDPAPFMQQYNTYVKPIIE